MNNKITRRQYISLLLSSLIGIGILSLPSEVCRIAKQDGWISVALGGLFPLYLLFTASYIHKKMNYEDFANITKKLYGKYLSLLIFIIISVSSLIYHVSIIANYTNIMKASISEFIPKVAIVGIITFLTINTSRNGLTIIGYLSEIALYFIIPLLLLPIIFIPKGSLTNVQPFFSSGKDILSAAPKGLLAYSGPEIAFITLHFITNKRKPYKSAMLATSIIVFLYTSTVFITIYYFGWKLTSKINFPLLFMYELIKVPILSDSKALFILVWSIAIFIVCNIYQFSICYYGSKIFNCEYKKISNIIFVVIFSLSSYAAYNDDFNIKILEPSEPYLSLFIIIIATVSSILVALKTRGEKRT
jgi:spore germination protein